MAGLTYLLYVRIVLKLFLYHVRNDNLYDVRLKQLATSRMEMCTDIYSEAYKL